MRRFAQVAFAFTMVLLAVTMFAFPAAAHTGLEASDPADGAVLDFPVEVITLVFSGEAEPTGDGFQVLDPNGVIRTPTEASTIDNLTWTLRFYPPLAGGVVGVRWMVKAPDAHPIDGSFSFTVPSIVDEHAWRLRRDSLGAVAGSVAVVGAHLFAGHTVTQGNRFLTGVTDMVHVAGASIWAGGVMMLASILWLRHRQERDLGAQQLAVRFSVIATVALVVVGVAGLILTVIVLDSPSELWSTEWGRVLMAKTVFVGVAAAAGGYNHWVLIPLLDTRPDSADLAQTFRNVVTGEVVALIAVFLTTAWLMGAAS